ncbi:uncharacterized protein I303_101210 [Kwoniella dejecticola CBS 10117]|uniref:Tetracycline efflux protein n=1 Tax=Kwoniella dejecticola CBS 10117 TaxID=1296121 RepID=A0A1A6AH50_9TREE|nr:tetracycline efflux protein [Kwoniella dejecticola CBS 10117]OBR89389.1 tetracycline efflux protein [Kwoniella dejecticola CBS 10117]
MSEKDPNNASPSTTIQKGGPFKPAQMTTSNSTRKYPRRGSILSTPQIDPNPNSNSNALSLSRVPTSSSIHTRNALRRMATHETGNYDPEDHEDEYINGDDALHTHDEHEHEHDGTPAQSRRNSDNTQDKLHNHGQSTSPEEGEDEEKQIEGKKTRFGGGKKKEVELQDQTNLLPVKQVVAVFVGLTCALFCSLLDQTIVTTALPTLGKVFNRADISSWVGTAYLLTSTTAQPIYGRVSDIFGRKFTLLACLFIFLMGSLACALAQSMIQLIIFRAIQGIGGGGILTLAMIIISDVVSIKERGKYQGITGVVVATANSCGPIVGGVFTEKVTWRWCFYINLPLTSLAMIIIVFLLPLRRVRGSMWGKLKKLDFYGSILTLGWASLILIALSWGGSQYAWSSAAVIAPLIIGLALLGVFLFVEWKVVSLPLVPMHIFKNMSVAACYVTTLFNGMAFYAALYYLPQYFQVVREVSAIRSGVLTLPLMLVQTCVAFTSGMIQSKTGDYWYNLVIGFGIWTIGLGLLSSIKPDTSEAKLAVYQVITGIGAGQTFQTSLVAIQSGVSRKDMATATGLRNFTRMLGGTIALAVGNAIVNNRVRSELNGVLSGDVLGIILSDPTQVKSVGLTDEQVGAVIQAYSKGINGIFYFTTPAIGLSCLITLFLVKNVKLKRGEDEAAKKAEAKAWIESKKAKRSAKKGELHLDGDAQDVSEEGTQDRAAEEEDRSRAQSESGSLDDSGSPEGKARNRIDSEDTVFDHPSTAERVKEGLEDVGKKEAEALAGPPSKQ